MADLRDALDTQVCIPVGCVPPACWPYLPACTAKGVSALRGCLLWGVSAPGGVSAPAGCICSGGCLLLVSQHALRQTPPPREQNTWHTLLKILPCPNFVAGGNNHSGSKLISFPYCRGGGWPNNGLAREGSYHENEIRDRTKFTFLSLILTNCILFLSNSFSSWHPPWLAPACLRNSRSTLVLLQAVKIPSTLKPTEQQY